MSQTGSNNPGSNDVPRQRRHLSHQARHQTGANPASGSGALPADVLQPELQLRAGCDHCGARRTFHDVRDAAAFLRQHFHRRC